mgnify:FL=1
MILSCHNVIMSNQSTFILGYLLFYGYDVTGHNYVLRCCGLFAGAVICSLVFYKNHRNRTFHRGFYHLFKEFHLFSARSSWYLRLSLGISTAMLIGELVHMPRVMWIGIAAMSVLLPFSKDMKYRVQRRGPFNILGCMIFLILHAILPDHIFSMDRSDRRDRSWLFCWICLANRFQHLWGSLYCRESFWPEECHHLKNRCQCLWLSLCLWI